MQGVDGQSRSRHRHDPERLTSYLEPAGLITLGTIVVLFVPRWAWWGLLMAGLGLLMILCTLGSLLLVRAHRRKKRRSAAPGRS
jgi:hypothetical protein